MAISKILMVVNTDDNLTRFRPIKITSISMQDCCKISLLINTAYASGQIFGLHNIPVLSPLLT